MTTKKRDQRQYDLVQQYLSGIMLNAVLGIIKELGDPYAVKPGLGGMTAYPPSAMAAVCIMLEAQRTTYRKMVGILRCNGAMAAKMSLDRIPSKSTIARAYGLIPEWYLAEVHRIVIREVEAGSLAGDSTGYSYLRFVRWFDVRTGGFRARKGWVKLHAIVDIRTRVIIDCMVTDGAVADINGLYAMLGRLGLSTGSFCLDSAYLARVMCDMISAMGMVPRIKPSPIPYATPGEASPGARWSTCTWMTGTGLIRNTTSTASSGQSLPPSRGCTGAAHCAAYRTTG